MSTSNTGLPDYIKFLDPHLALIVIEFYLNKTKGEELLKYKKQMLLKTMLFEQQQKLYEEHPDLFDQNEKNQIEIKREQQEKGEAECKSKLIGFLNLIDNCRRNNDYDTSASMSKKIVSILN